MTKFREMKDRLKVAVPMVAVAVMSVPAVVFAEDGTAAAMTTALEAVKTDSLAVLSSVAPIGIAIAGAFMVWRLGMKFFKGLAK